MPYLNDAFREPSAANQVRKPLLQVLCNGKPIAGAIKASVRSVGHYHADTFTCEFNLDADRDFSLKWWGSWDATVAPLLLDIQVGLVTGANEESIYWKSLILGMVDHIQCHVETRIMVVEGRDLSGLLVDYKTQAAYPNKTSSQIAQLLCAQVKPPIKVVAKPTSILTGRYYSAEHNELTNDNFSKTVSAWDLLTNLAQKEQYDLFVAGDTLYFEPLRKADETPWLLDVKRPKIAGNTSSGLVMTTPRLSVDRSMTLAKDIVVVVQSWNSGTGKKIRATYPNKGTSSLHAAKSNLQQYVFTIPNLKDANEALREAQSRYSDIVKNERIIEWEEPGQLATSGQYTLSPRNIVLLQGTDSSWDGHYFIDTLTWDISFDSGFTMNIRAKNKGTATQTTL